MTAPDFLNHIYGKNRHQHFILVTFGSKITSGLQVICNFLNVLFCIFRIFVFSNEHIIFTIKKNI